ncbi:intermembrane lipid transfer protein vps13F-like [Aethina tumida]|uniref:intermembrane lipid transfer protein vps13F-like n=1 Tax=Aethina tumida TaxID=116153 RepID=UPI002148F531|nr:intermembrane lipid transfer protein vps13F-like [Aethina tumida]
MEVEEEEEEDVKYSDSNNNNNDDGNNDEYPMAKQTRHGSSNNNKNYNNRKHHNDKIDLVNELHRPMRINFPRRQTVVKGLDDLWQSDLGILDKYAKYNRNYKYILVVIDCFSKYLWVEPLKSKTGTEVAKAFAKILTDRRPKNLQTDQGTEYFNSSFERLMKQHNINHYNTFISKKAAMAERVIRTIKEKLCKHFSLNGEYKWLDVIPKIVSDYNNTVHRTIKMRPSDVNKENEERL